MKKNTTSKKKSSLLKKLFIGASAFVLANVAGCLKVVQRYNKKMKDHENENNAVNSSVFQNTEVCIASGINNAYVASFSGKMDLKVQKPDHEVMVVELTAFLSSVKIYVPRDVKIICEGPIPSSVKDVPEDMDSELEFLPEIHFLINSMASKIVFVAQAM